MTRDVGAGARTHGFGHRGLVLPTIRVRQLCRRVVLLIYGLACLAGLPVWASSANYYYDELGRLVETVAADGTSVLYSYDAVGNITSVRHNNVSTVGISGFNPLSGPVGTSVTVFGSGFSTTLATNVVKFNGTSATVTAATATSLVVTVPTGASTGAINITNGAASATSSGSFVVGSLAVPTVTGFTPTIGAQGTAVTVSGTNFQAAIALDKIQFGTILAATSTAVATTLTTNVPGPASSGKVSVTTPYGIGTSAADFYAVPPGYALGDVQFTGRVAIGGSSFIGTTTVAGKIGLMLFDGVVGNAPYLQLTAVTAPGGTASVFRPDGSLLGSVPIANALAKLPTLTMTGTYTVVLAPSSPTPLSMQLKLVPEMTVDGAALNITSVAAGYGAFASFSGTAGQNLALELTGLTFSGGAGGGVFLVVNGPDGSQIGINYNCGTDNPNHACNLELANLPLTGRYQIVVVNQASPAIMGGALTLSSDKTGTLISGTAYPLSLHAGQNGRLTFAGTAATHTLTVSVPTTDPAGQTVSVTVLDASSNTVTSGSFSTAGGTLTLGTLGASTYTVLVNSGYGAAAAVTLTYQ